MKIKAYVRDKIVSILIYISMTFLIINFLAAVRVPFFLIVIILLLLLFGGSFLFIYDLLRKKNFYDRFKRNLEELDKKYLITEVMEEPNFFEGMILYQSLYEIDKSMNDRIAMFRKSTESLKEYIELWIHEVKLPVAGIHLILHNHKSEASDSLLEQTRRIENYVEQVLYFVRSEHSQKDYLFKECRLKDMVRPVIKKNKEGFIYNKISLTMEDLEWTVLTDTKWVEFIISQIISNSIKYRRQDNARIKVSARREHRTVTLVIEDNGIGIVDSELSRVFDKSFTGTNGRVVGSSTGMGLYICKGLCDKMGHSINIFSQLGEGTRVEICFNEDEYYHVLKPSKCQSDL